MNTGLCVWKYIEHIHRSHNTLTITTIYRIYSNHSPLCFVYLILQDSETISSLSPQVLLFADCAIAIVTTHTWVDIIAGNENILSKIF